jgi:uncharacterized circularly permuted ATP-grasp superfamily protein
MEIPSLDFNSYALDGFFDEMFASDGSVHPHYERLRTRFERLTLSELEERRQMAHSSFRNQGITFTVYNDDRGTERIFPFDLLPRIIPADEWKTIEEGLTQRITALNLFLHDIYHDQKIIRDGIVDRQLIESAAHFRREFIGFDVPRNIYIHICGTDLVRDESGQYLVLEETRFPCPLQ